MKKGENCFGWSQAAQGCTKVILLLDFCFVFPPEEEAFETIYHEFPGTFTTNLAGSRKMLQVGVGVSTQYDDTVMMNVESHQLALRSVILGVISDFSEDDVKGATGRDKLAVALRDAINTKLEALENFGGVEEVHFTSFVLQ